MRYLRTAQRVGLRHHVLNRRRSRNRGPIQRLITPPPRIPHPRIQELAEEKNEQQQTNNNNNNNINYQLNHNQQQQQQQQQQAQQQQQQQQPMSHYINNRNINNAHNHNVNQPQRRGVFIICFLFYVVLL